MFKKTLFLMFFVLIPLFSYGQEHTQEFNDFMESIWEIQTDVNDIWEVSEQWNQTWILENIWNTTWNTKKETDWNVSPLTILSWVITSWSIFFYVWKKYRNK